MRYPAHFWAVVGFLPCPAYARTGQETLACTLRSTHPRTQFVHSASANEEGLDRLSAVFEAQEFRAPNTGDSEYTGRWPGGQNGNPSL